jgi:hypothetical protein
MFTQRNGCPGSISSTIEFTSSCVLTKARPLRKDQRGVDLISDALLFGRLWYLEVRHAIGYANSTAAHMMP